MQANNFVGKIGSSVVNEYEETIGMIIGFTTDGIGEVKSVLIKTALDIHEVPIDMIEETGEAKYKLLSSFTYSFKNLEKKMKIVYSRIESLSKISPEEVEKGIYENLKNKAESVYKELQEEASALKNKILSRIEYLSRLNYKLDEAIAELKIAYVSGDVDKFSYDSKLELLKSNKERIIRETNNLRELLNSVESLNKEGIIEVRVVG